MGYHPNEPYSWVDTDTDQLITHEVSPAEKGHNEEIVTQIRQEQILLIMTDDLV